jgi:hypothetical protein
MVNRRTLALILAASTACASGGSTTITTSWRDPDAGTLAFHRILAAYVTNDPAMRRTVEDRLARNIPNSFPAYSAVPELSLTDQQRARSQLRDRLFDGAILMRVVDVENQQTYIPGSSWYATYPNFYGYWGSSWGMVRDPGYVVNNKFVTVETAVYSISDDKLVWAGRTRSENPGSATKLVDKTVDAVAKELRAQKLIQ